jgi:hypothetical protein
MNKVNCQMSITTSRVTDHHKDKNLRRLLEVLEIKDWQTIRRLEERSLGPTRQGVKIEIARKASPCNEKLLIDHIIGKPSVKQVYNAIYGMGSDCTRRVILFWDDSKGYSNASDPEEGQEITENWIRAMNRNGSCLYLVEAARKKKGLDFKLAVRAPNISVLDKIHFPSKEKSIEAIFWGIYYRNNMWVHPDGTFKDGFDNKTVFEHRISLDNIEITGRWADKGATVCITGKSGGTSYVKKIWEKKAPELREAFKRCDIRYSFAAGGPARISIELWPNPVSVLLGASVSEKEAYADLLWQKVSRIRRLTGDFVWCTNEGCGTDSFRS